MTCTRILVVALGIATLLLDADVDALLDVDTLQMPHQAIKRQSPFFVGGNEGAAKSDVYSATPELVVKHGYPVETHEVQTDDGFLLTVHRIPHGRDAGSATPPRPVVLVMHGLLAASDLWVLTGPERGLGFVLADAGYDVWLGNARGNYYSKKHTTLNPMDSRFWDFSWHEMGVSDLPAVIDYILAKTGQSKLFYIGHSMGTTMFFAMASIRPEYNDKIRLMVGLAPVVAMSDQLKLSLDKLLPPVAKIMIDSLLRSGRNHEVFPRLLANSRLTELKCQDGQIGQKWCMDMYFSMYGANRQQLNTTMLPVILSHLVSGTSASTIQHYILNYKANRFQWYDKSRTQQQMPLYNLALISAPVSLHYAMNDALLNPDAVMELSRSLPNVVKMHRLTDDNANHMDLVLAIDVKQLVFNEVLSVMKNF